ncbi:MAG: hypothetical protein ACLQFW_09355 [Xanthobacteraceae bacterium]
MSASGIDLIVVNVAHTRYEPSALEIFLSLHDVGLTPINGQYRDRKDETEPAGDSVREFFIVGSELHPQGGRNHNQT